MRRREFIGLVGGAAAWPVAARAQQAGKVYRVAYVGFAARLPELVVASPINPAARAFKQGLRDLGYVEGKNLLLEWRTAEGHVDRLPEIIRELVSINVDVILSGAETVTRAAHSVTQTVPIVIASDARPVELGFAQSLARPGGNVTGLTVQVGPEIIGKRLQLFKELLPDTKRVAYLFSVEVDSAMRTYVETVSGQLGLKLVPAEHAPRDYSSAFALISRERPDAVFVASSSGSYNSRRLIVAFAAENQLPTMYWSREFVDDGGLIAYGANLPDLFRHAAGYVDKILKGANPGELPIELPRKFDLVINMKAAKALGITVPPTLLAAADELIE